MEIFGSGSGFSLAGMLDGGVNALFAYNEAKNQRDINIQRERAKIEQARLANVAQRQKNMSLEKMAMIAGAVVLIMVVLKMVNKV